MPLASDGSNSYEAARAVVEAEGFDGFVAKNVLRPRTGSGVTQDRLSSGGMIVSDPVALRGLLDDEQRRGCYVLYRKVSPMTHDATVMHESGEYRLEREHEHPAMSELATFGAYLSASQCGGGDAPLVNRLAGMGARTRPARPDHPLSKGLGYGAISCVQRV